MQKQSALILAIGFIIGSAIIYLGLKQLGSSIFLAGSAAQPHHQIDLKIVGDSGSSAPISIQLKGDSHDDPVFIHEKSK
jgi:hypothetical protein